MGEQRSILIVDDEPKICHFLEVLAERDGYRATTARSGSEALGLVQGTRFDLILTDLKMPGMNGLEFIRRVKEVSPDVPIVVITGFATLETAVEALRTGADDYIAKPFNIEELRRVMKRLLERGPARSVGAKATTGEETAGHGTRQPGQAGEASGGRETVGVEPARRPRLVAAGESIPPDRLQSFLAQTLAAINQSLRAASSSIMLCTGESLELRVCEEGRARRLIGVQQPIHRGVAGLVAREGKPLLVTRAEQRAKLPPAESGSYSGASFMCVPVMHRGRALGVINVAEKATGQPFDEQDLDLVVGLAEEVAPAIAVAVESYAEQVRLRGVLEDLSDTYESKDPYMRDHSRRVAEYAVALMRACGATAAEIEIVHHAGRLHDIGKVSVSEGITAKVGPLTEEERERLRQHPIIGARMVERINCLRDLVPVIRHHHERPDGLGYPDRLSGDAIPRLARAVAIADAYDAMISERPYRPALSREAAVAAIRAGAGLQFDVEMARIFCEEVVATVS